MNSDSSSVASPGQRGFSLIELVAVLGVLVLLLAAGMGARRSSPTAALSLGGQLVAQLVVDARNLAAATQAPVRLVISGESGSDASAPPRWSQLRIYQTGTIAPDDWIPAGPVHQLPPHTGISPPSPAGGTTPGSLLLAAPVPLRASAAGGSRPASSVIYVEFQPPGDFRPRADDGTGLILIEATPRETGQPRRSVLWRINGGVTVRDEPVFP